MSPVEANRPGRSTLCPVLARTACGAYGHHSFVSHALAGGRSLAEVRDAAGHANIATTSVYLHIATDDGDEPGDLFDFGG